MRYRRTTLERGSWFFTIVTRDRSPLLSDAAAVARFTSALRHVRARHPFETLALVVLPDHVHAVWSIADGDFATRWRLIKGRFSRLTPITADARSGRQERRERGLWQPRYWEHAIHDERDLRAHLDDVRYNPLKHGLARAPTDWPYSTFARAVSAGWYSAGCGMTPPESPTSARE